MEYKLEDSWKELLKDAFDVDYKRKLFSALNKEYETQSIFPPKEKVFASLNFVPYDKIKVVIIGQDPYHVAGQADGLAFSCAKGRPQPSLVNIFKEIESDIGSKPKTTGDLSKWAEQGVLLLNTSLTVRENMPGSHANIGWDVFTKKVIEIISKNDNPIVFMLWGNFAKSFAPLITNKNHLVLTAAHPSPFSAYNGFFGCKHFSKANNFLIKNNILPIDWCV